MLAKAPGGSLGRAAGNGSLELLRASPTTYTALKPGTRKVRAEWHGFQLHNKYGLETLSGSGPGKNITEDLGHGDGVPIMMSPCPV